VQFRKDINGLRAIAVIAVVLFHFNASWMPGGFAGVDVFFVISGFLMTGIIFRGIDNNNLSILKFYIARANRIIPALAVLCLTLLAFAWFSELDTVFKTIAKHITASVLFLSNIVYWQESGYFDASSHEKWLLHTWSLSAEWQFYIIYPFVLFFISKFLRLGILKSIILIATILGFIFCVYVTYKYPNPAYYLLPTRAWEMMLGGVAYLYPVNLKEQSKKLVEWFGLALILVSYFFISSDNPWPGYLALLPVLGAFLIIQAQRNDSLITGNPLFQKLGAWSYSIYLWHWPLVVYMFTNVKSTTVNIALFIALSVILGMLSYTMIEKKITGKKTLWLWLSTITLSILVYANNGHIEAREKSQDIGNEILQTYQDYDFDVTGLWEQCNAKSKLTKTGSPQVNSTCISTEVGGIFLWGDSHMGALSIGIRDGMIKDTPFSQLASSGCAPSFLIKRNGTNDTDTGCDYSNSFAESAIQQAKPKVVIIGSRNEHEKNDWAKTISKLHELGVAKVIVLGPLPQWKTSLPIVYTKRHMGEEFISDFKFETSLIESNNSLINLHAKDNNFVFINLLEQLCVESEEGNLACKAKIGDALMAFDYGHPTNEAARFISKKYIIPHF